LDPRKLITLRPTENLEWVRAIATHPDVWLSARLHDAVPKREEWQAPKDFTYLAVYRGRTPCGVIMLEPITDHTFRAHIAMLASGWGMTSTLAALGAIRWASGHTQANLLIAEIPDYNDKAIGLMQRIGATEVERKPDAFLKDGKPHDARCFEVKIER
jgi:RimJ/RimL family protein N-acetyltransferase